MSTLTTASRPVEDAVHHQIERIIYLFFRYLDDQQYDELAALFAPEGVWHRAGKALRGPNGVREAMAQRPAGFTTRHIITNIVIDATSSNHVHASYYMTVFMHEGAERATKQVPLELPLHVSVFDQTFIRSGSGWLIQGLSGLPTFHR